MLQFCLIWIECIPKVLHKSFFFFRYKRILTREITSESSLCPPFWFRHLCCDVTSGISAHRKSKTSLGPLQARVLSSFLQEYFLVLTLVKRCVVGSCNNSNKTGHSTHFVFQKKKEFGASGSKLNVQTSLTAYRTLYNLWPSFCTRMFRGWCDGKNGTQI